MELSASTLVQSQVFTWAMWLSTWLSSWHGCHGFFFFFLLYLFGMGEGIVNSLAPFYSFLWFIFLHSMATNYHDMDDCAGGQPGKHSIQGMGAGFIPDVLDVKILDRVITVHSDEAMEMSRRLHTEDGLLAGISSGAAFAAALKVWKLSECFFLSTTPLQTHLWLEGICFINQILHRSCLNSI